MCVCVCVCVHARARALAYACVCVIACTWTHSIPHQTRPTSAPSSLAPDVSARSVLSIVCVHVCAYTYTHVPVYTRTCIRMRPYTHSPIARRHAHKRPIVDLARPSAPRAPPSHVAAPPAWLGAGGGGRREACTCGVQGAGAPAQRLEYARRTVSAVGG